MMNRLKNFPFKRVLVLGLAKSGTATCRVLHRNGIDVIANDLSADEKSKEINELKQMGIELVIGHHPISIVDEVDAVIKNPGIPYENIIVKHALKRNLPVWTEIELLYYLIDQPIIGITGSNGKTTTTMLVEAMLKNSEKKAKVAGNIGEVAVEVAEQITEDEILVLELSSFQLMGVERFQPKIAVILNLFESHLDYHGDFESYKAAKANILTKLTGDDFLIYNADDPDVLSMIQKTEAKRIPFSVKNQHDKGVWTDGTFVYFENQEIIQIEKIRLVGDHNLENILASVAASMLVGANKQGIEQALTTFSGVKHRLQFVAEKQGRIFYNDSKATNILASSKALKSFDQPILLIAGGLDRGNEFDELLPYLSNVKGLFLYGETKEKLAYLGRKAKIPLIETGATLEEMTTLAFTKSNPGDLILLSPACASWDQFKTFEERGNMFIDTVHRL